MKRVLFISGSIGLGHVNRDLAIAGELSRQMPGIDITWLASEPAKSVIREAGGRLDPRIGQYGNDTAVARRTSGGEALNLSRYVMNAMVFSKEWRRNVNVLRQIVKQGGIDLVIGDETYEVVIALLLRTLKLSFALPAGPPLPANADAVSDLKTGGVAAHFRYRADNFMAGNKWIVSNVIEIINCIPDAPSSSMTIPSSTAP